MNISLRFLIVGLIGVFYFNKNGTELMAQCDTSASDSYFYNLDFELYNTCPNARGQLNFLDGWEQVSTATSDFYHSCGLLQDNAIDTRPLEPFPAGRSATGTGAVGFRTETKGVSNGDANYVEYVGQCLRQPLKIGSTYIIKFYAAALKMDGMTGATSDFTGDIVILGRQNCDGIPIPQMADL